MTKLTIDDMKAYHRKRWNKRIVRLMKTFLTDEQVDYLDNKMYDILMREGNSND